MTGPADDELDLFERFKQFAEPREWTTMIDLASTRAMIRFPMEPGELGIESWLKWWLSDIDTPEHQDRLNRAMLISNEKPTVLSNLLCLDRLGRREIARFIEAGQAGRFTITGIAGAEQKNFGAEIWRAVSRINFWDHTLSLTTGATIGGVRTTTGSPQDTPHRPPVTDQKSGGGEPELRPTKDVAIINRKGGLR